MPADDRTATVEFSPDAYERLSEVSDDPAALVHEAAMRRMEVEKSIEFTRNEDFHSEKGFELLNDDVPPPLSALLGIEWISLADGECKLVMETHPDHTNQMGTLQGGVIYALGGHDEFHRRSATNVQISERTRGYLKDRESVCQRHAVVGDTTRSSPPDSLRASDRQPDALAR